MSNLELRIEEEANLGLTISDSSDMSFDAVDFVGVPFAPTVEVEDIEGGHRVSITSMGAEGKKTDEFDVMDGADGATGPQGPKGDSYEITAADYAEIAEVVEGDIQDVIDAAQGAASDATAAAAKARAASAATWLSGNALFGELAEGTILTADDAYAAPPKGVEVFGKSTQVQTTGKNLIPTTIPSNAIHATMSGSSGEYVENTLVVAGNAWVFAIPCERNTTYYFSSNANGTIGGLGLSDRLPVLNDTCTKIALMSGMSAHSILTGENDYILIQVSSTAAFNNIPVYKGMLEKGTSGTSYEPYSGGAASPRPDWPQSILSVDDLTLNVCGKNLFNLNGEYDANKYYNSTGARNNNNGWGVFYIPCIAGNSYTLSGMNVENATRIVLVSARGETGRVIGIGNTVLTAITVTPDTDGLLAINLRISGDNTELDNNIQLELGTAATAYAPYIGQSVSIPLSNHIARSLPDGTRDTLTLTYQGPSTREGWGVFGAELASNCWNVNLGELVWSYDTTSGTYPIFKSSSLRDTDYLAATGSAYAPYYLCTTYDIWPTAGNLTNYANRINDDSIAITASGTRSIIVVRDDSYSNVEDFVAAVTGEELQYHLLVPFTTDLGTVELPVNPAPELTAWADGGSAQPTLAMEYERALSIVIPRIEAAISDLATS